MRHCIQRYASGIYIDCKFEGIHQNSVYTRMLALILQIRSDPYHKEKHNNNRRLWADLGMYVTFFYLFFHIFIYSRQYLRPQAEVEDHDLDVILD